MLVPFVFIDKISKKFGNVYALKNISLSINCSEVIGICGENGAGKSTLVKLLTGLHQPDEGCIHFDNQIKSIKGPAEAQRLGIALVSQELSLAPDLSVLDNIWLGNQQIPFFHKKSKFLNKAIESLELLGLDASVINRPVGLLSLAEKQLVEIARNLCRDARLILMDEPTATLSDREIELLFKAIKRLKADGKSILYISHRITELFSICDRVSILRNGELIKNTNINEINKTSLIELMIGRELNEIYPLKTKCFGQELLKVNGLNLPGIVQDVNFSLKKGQIIGISGQIGSGASEVIRSLAGLNPLASGDIYIEGDLIKLSSRDKMLKKGISFISEDRAAEGIFLKKDIRENLVVSRFSEVMSFGLLNWVKLNIKAKIFAISVGLDHTRLKDEAQNLSGGNQQKIAFGRNIDSLNIKLLIMNEPTRGVDIGARAEIYLILRQFCEKGFGILFHSTDLEEITGLSDQVITMYRGEIKNFYDQNEINFHDILKDITNVLPDAM